MRPIPVSKPIFDPDLIRRYDTAGPRYTSYPTALQFSDQFTIKDYFDQAKAGNELADPYPLSLYFHIPFCQTLCFYCACNKIVTKRKEKALDYLRRLEREIEIQGQLYSRQRMVTQLHLGGGTPTFLSRQQIQQLLQQTAQHFTFAAPEQREFSIEIDPRTIDYDYLATLRESGFNRLSFGVQDFNQSVQQAVHRIQSQQQTTELLQQARALGFASISLDLIYGLPLQTIDSFAQTLDSIIELRPDRLSLFNYAHLPDRFMPQQRINAADLPSSEQKLQILKNAINALDQAGYVYIGMDHFALPDDELAKARLNGSLRRNFQGYSSHRHTDLVALGVSSISSVGTVYAQNYKTLEQYYQAINENRIPIEKGYSMNRDDQLRQFVIMQLMCYETLQFADFDQRFGEHFNEYFAAELTRLQQMQHDGLLEMDAQQLAIRPPGRLLLRNVAMVFDAYLQRGSATERFSRTI